MKKKSNRDNSTLTLCNAQLNEDAIFEILKNNLQHFNYLGLIGLSMRFMLQEIRIFKRHTWQASEAILNHNECSSENWKLLNSATTHDYEYKKNYRISNSVLETGLINDGIIEVYLKACMNIGKVDEAIYFLESSNFQWQEFSILLMAWLLFYES